MYKKTRSTQRTRHSLSSGHVHRSPTGHNPHRAGAEPTDLQDHPSADSHFGPRVGRKVNRLTNMTVERARMTASPLSKRFTKFITNMHGQVKVPHDVVGRKGMVVPGGVKCIDVGQPPED